jgi:hypothetical protein
MFGFPSGLENMIMNSSENADRLIEAFKDVIDAGKNPEDVEAEIYAELGINPNDIIHSDRVRILDEINEYWEEHNA